MKRSFIILFAVLLVGCTSTRGEAQPQVVQRREATATIDQPADRPTDQPTPPPAPTHTATLTATLAPPTASATPTAPPATPSPSPSPSPSPTPAVTATLSPDAWQTLPVVPTGVSPKVCQIYTLGQMLGNNPRAFSKVGDCQTMLPNFLGYFDEGRYDLGPYAGLQPVIDYFSGSFGRNSRAVKDGLSASAALAVLWNDWKDCGEMETPLDCEYRIHRPSFAIISLGTNDANGYAPFETTLRRVIDVTIGHGVVPILATKADNAEGDHALNATIVRLAYEYDLPLWNFWLAVQPLPEHGLRSPEHLTYGEYILTTDFSDPANLEYAFNIRNLTALQVLDVTARGCGGPLPTATPIP